MRHLNRPLSFLLALGLLTASACSFPSRDGSFPDDEPAVSDTDAGPADDAPDTQNPNSGDDAAPQADDTPDTPDTPGADAGPEEAALAQPSRISVSVEPGGLVVPGTLVLPVVEITLEDGAIGAADLATLTVTPAGAATPAGDRFEIRGEGRITFTACAPSDYYADEDELCASASILSDAGLPTIVIDAPSPGERIIGRGTVTVRGRVTDTHGSVAAYLDGRELPLDGSGRFSVEVFPTFGINHVAVSASDGVRPDESAVFVDYLWAPASQPVDGDRVVLENGVALRLGADFFDDNETEELVDGRAEIDDIASYVEILLQHADFGAIASNYGLPRYGIEVVDARIGDAFVEVTLLDNGFELRMDIPDLEVEFTGINPGGWPRLPYDGTVSTSATLYVRFETRKAGPREPLRVSPRDLQVNLGDLTGEFDNQFTQGAWDLAYDDVHGPVTERIQNGVVAGFVLRMAETLSDGLAEVDRALWAQEYALPLPGGDANLTWGGLGTTVTTSAGAMVIEAPLLADAGPLFRGRDGVASHNPEPAPFLETSRLQAAVPLASFNAPLHVLWGSGALAFDGRSELAPTVAQLITRADVTLGLPPVVAPSQDPAHDLVLQLGQIEIELEVRGETARFGASVDIPGNIVLEDGDVFFRPDGAPAINGWVINADSALPGLNADAVVAILRDAVTDHLLNVLEDLRVTIPQLRFFPGRVLNAPSIPVTSVNFARAPVVRSGYLLLDADTRFSVRVD